MGRNQFISDQLRKIMDESELSRYEISKRTGIDQATLTRFYHGTGGLSLSALDALGECLGLSIVMKVKPKRDSK